MTDATPEVRAVFTEIICCLLRSPSGRPLCVWAFKTLHPQRGGCLSRMGLSETSCVGIYTLCHNAKVGEFFFLTLFYN